MSNFVFPSSVFISIFIIPRPTNNCIKIPATTTGAIPTLAKVPKFDPNNHKNCSSLAETSGDIPNKGIDARTVYNATTNNVLYTLSLKDNNFLVLQQLVSMRLFYLLCS